MVKLMKNNINIKKIVALLLIIFTISSITYPIFAASGSGVWIGAQYASRVQTTTSTGNNGIIIRRLQNQKTNERITVFCAEHRSAISNIRMGSRRFL